MTSLTTAAAAPPTQRLSVRRSLVVSVLLMVALSVWWDRSQLTPREKMLVGVWVYPRNDAIGHRRMHACIFFPDRRLQYITGLEPGVEQQTRHVIEGDWWVSGDQLSLRPDSPRSTRRFLFWNAVEQLLHGNFAQDLHTLLDIDRRKLIEQSDERFTLLRKSPPAGHPNYPEVWVRTKE